MKNGISEELRNAFDNWVSVQTREWEDDCCGEHPSEFYSRMDGEREEFESGQDLDWWMEELQNYTDISDY